jgi:hypothetical protein
MTSDEMERAYQLIDELNKEVSALVGAKLAGEKPEVDEFVRQLMTEQFRFWK